MNKPVNFEIAKLLKDKGFNESCTQLYFDGELKDITVKKVSYDDTLSSRYYIAPTIAEVVMWLYEKHSIWINSSFDGGALCFYYVIHFSTNEEHALRINSLPVRFNSPTEAYESAIIHVLENLI